MQTKINPFTRLDERKCCALSCTLFLGKQTNKPRSAFKENWTFYLRSSLAPTFFIGHFINNRFYEIFVSTLGVGYFPIGNPFLILYLNPLTIRSMCIVKLDFTRIGRRNYRYVSDKYELSN